MSSTYPYYPNTNYQTSGNDLSSLLPVAYGTLTWNGTAGSYSTDFTTNCMNCTITPSTTYPGIYTILVNNSTNLKKILVGTVIVGSNTSNGWTLSTNSWTTNSVSIRTQTGGSNPQSQYISFSFIIY